MSVSDLDPRAADPADLVECPVCHDLGEETTFRLPEQLALYERHFDRAPRGTVTSSMRRRLREGAGVVRPGVG
jgi:hypothetical protein